MFLFIFNFLKQLFGFLGILIAVPVATVLMEVLSDHERRKLAGRQIAQK